MRVFITSWLANSITLYLVARLLPGITIDNLVPPGGGIITQQGLIHVLVGALILGALNSCVGPVLRLLSLPLTCLTLGLFSFIINGIVFNLGVWLTPGLTVKSFWWAVGGGTLFGIINSMVNGLLGVHKDQDEE